MIGPIAATQLRLQIEGFEQAVATLWDQPMPPELRAALTAVRASWNTLADAAFGAIERSRGCPSCKRDGTQSGPRCRYCWHRLATFESYADAADVRTIALRRA